MKEKGSVYLPHTAGRYAAKRFRKAHVSSIASDDTGGRNFCNVGVSINEYQFCSWPSIIIYFLVVIHDAQLCCLDHEPDSLPYHCWRSV